MAEEYLLVRNTTFDQMKKKLNQKNEEYFEKEDRGVNMDSVNIEKETSEKHQDASDPIQRGNGLIFVGKRKESASPPGMKRLPIKKRKWLTF